MLHNLGLTTEAHDALHQGIRKLGDSPLLRDALARLRREAFIVLDGKKT